MEPERRIVAADVGGTFTDCVAWTGDGIAVAKVATASDESQSVLEGSRSLLDGRRAVAFLHGSTVATNALLERRGADTVLITDEGFDDVIEIGRQDRPSLYDSFADRSTPLVSRQDRMGTNDPAQVAEWVGRRSPESVAVSLAYSFDDPSGELLIAAALDSMGIPISLSHLVAPEFREFERTSTTVLNAYLGPRVGGYLRRLARRATTMTDRVQVMRSSGGLMTLDEGAGLAAALLLSGPAGGVVAATEMGRARRQPDLITFDMGGTSTDVCRIEDGRAALAYERMVDGFVCRMPSVAIHTVGAGGGSLAWIDPGRSLRVGPQSAGALPGPAAYGLGGTEATVTDAHVVLGRIGGDVRLGGTLELDPAAAREAVGRLAARLDLGPLPAAEGILEVVEAHMERAIRRVSVEQGSDPRQAALVAFGGAGGLHATSLARRLGMASVVVPPFAGVFSALGLLMAPPRVDGANSIVLTEADDLAAASSRVAERVVSEFTRANGRPPAAVTRHVDMRYRGQSHEITVPVGEGEALASAAGTFHRLHADINGFARPGDPVEAVTVRVVAEGRPLLTWDDLPRSRAGPLPPSHRRSMVMGGEEVESEVWWRPELPAGAEVRGPAVITEEVGTTVLRPGDRAVVASDGALEVTW
ncbi:MAG TPA: hydantoinase/oxoprolinase family protein [Acidimicrobiia bacterium]|nr:hydantoinase/oxoprolinase family protein [Acidimicrobiia bacterium]